MKARAKLIRTIFEAGSYSEAGREAIGELVATGEVGLDTFLTSLKSIPPSNLHPRDLHDTISHVYGEFAIHCAEAFIDRFEAGRIDEFNAYWALGAAKGRRSIDILIAGLKSKEKFIRWAAAESLIQRRSKRAVKPLIGLLNDRVQMATGTIVEAMRLDRIFRHHDALPALGRLITKKSIQKRSPGLVERATEVIMLIKSESR